MDMCSITVIGSGPRGDRSSPSRSELYSPGGQTSDGGAESSLLFNGLPGSLLLVEFAATFPAQDDENSQDEENSGKHQTTDPQRRIIIVEWIGFLCLGTNGCCAHDGAVEEEKRGLHGWEHFSLRLRNKVGLFPPGSQWV